MSEQPYQYLAAVVGAGPAGIYAAETLAENGVRVALFNRDVKPGGLAEYGIYPDKEKMKGGLRKQFHQVLSHPGISYFGNVVVGQHGDLTLDDLRSLGFQVIVMSVGAQGTKWLGLPGEDLKGVYHAKDIVYHYNKLPPYSAKPFPVGKRVALVGVGNVSLDIAHWVVRDLKVDEVVTVARRGPAEVKFTRKEFEYVAKNLDMAAFDAEMERMRPVMEAVNQDVQAARDAILAALKKADEPVSNTRFLFDFCASPTRILGDEDGQVTGLEVEETYLVAANGDTKARGTGVKRVIPTDTVVFCIGDRVDESVGLPVSWNEFAKNPEPSFPVEGVSYEAYDPQSKQPIRDIFMVGWAREASSGLVGVARKDGTLGAQAALAYLKTLPGAGSLSLEAVEARLKTKGIVVVSKDDWQKLSAIEAAEAQKRGLESFKFGTNEEMLAVLGLG